MSWLSRARTRWVAPLAGVAAAMAFAAPASAQSIIRDTEIEGIIGEWTQPVFVAMGLNPDDVELLLVNDAELNAFATRGRIMGINTGLILRTDTPNQLLGVIAHEAGHVKNRHPMRDGAAAAGSQPFWMSMALGALAMAAGAPGAGAALMGSSQMFGTIGALKYMQGQEGEADLTALRGMDAAGQSGRGLVEFFENFRSQEVFSDARRYPYFRSHPLSSQRIEALRRPAEASANYGRSDSPERMAQHALILAKIHGFMDHPNATLRKYPETDVSLPARYARAIAWYRDGQTDKALGAVDALMESDPENPYFWELKGQILFEEGRPAEAIGAHQRSVELKPDAPLLRVNLAHALLESGEQANLDPAIDQLKRATALERDNTMAWRLLGQAYDRQGKEGEARLASAEMYYAAGDTRQATQFALRARDMLTQNSQEYRRAMDIVFASGATQDDLDDLERRQRRQAGADFQPVP